MPRLVITNLSLAGSMFELGEGWATVGRADGNAIQVVEPSVSGRHCEVRVRAGELQVRDLVSTNGTFVGGARIAEASVRPGQSLRLGDVELRFESVAVAGKSAGVPLPVPGSFATEMETMFLARPPAAEKNRPPENLPPSDASKLFHVLFVDDSLAFLELFGALCQEYSRRTWQLYTATSADKALLTLQDRPVDLVVLDIGMPMLDGLQLLAIVRRRYPGMKVAVLTGNASDTRRADALANGAELFLEKPVTAEGMKSAFNVLHDLVSWDSEGFSGSVRQVGLQEVIQMECNGRHSSVLEIRSPERRGQIYIEAGAVIHANAGDATGEQAFFQLLSMRGGDFQVKPFKAPTQRTIHQPWEVLVMESARISDETSFLQKSLATKINRAELGGKIVTTSG
jgi:CheY-like chemotaxis protein